MGIIIRKALPEDAENYSDCVASCWQTAYKGIVSDEYLAALPAQQKQRIWERKNSFANPGDCEYYCVMNNEKMVGVLTIHISDRNIWAIYLIEEFRGKGYGRQIMDFAVNRLNYYKREKISLWTFEKNIKAKRFYEKYGFYLDGKKRENDKYGGVMLKQVSYTLDV